MEAFGQRVEDSIQVIFARQPMIAGHAEIGSPQPFVVSQVRTAFGLGAEPNPIRKHARQEQGIVPDVGPDVEAGSVVSRLQGGQHLEEVIDRLALDHTTGSLEMRELSQHRSHVVRQGTPAQARTPQAVADQDVKIEVSGNREAVGVRQHSLKQGVVIEDEVTSLLIAEQARDCLSGTSFGSQHPEDKIDVLSSELNPTVRPDDHHISSPQVIGFQGDCLNIEQNRAPRKARSWRQMRPA